MFPLLRLLMLVKALILSLLHESGNGVRLGRCERIGPACCLLAAQLCSRVPVRSRGFAPGRR